MLHSLRRGARSSDRPFQITEELEGIGAAEAMAMIMSGREKLARIVLKRAAEMTLPCGIELDDVRFRRINYVETRSSCHAGPPAVFAPRAGVCVKARSPRES